MTGFWSFPLSGTRVSAQTVFRAVQALTPLVERSHTRSREDQYRVLLLDGVTQSIRTIAGREKKERGPIGCLTNPASRERIIYAVVVDQNAKREREPLLRFTHNS